MDRLSILLFESPLQLLAVLILIEATLVTVWWFRSTPRNAWLIVGGLFVSAILLIVQQVVVTDREQIRQLLEDLALAVDCENIEPIAAATDEEFLGDDMNKAKLLERVRTAFERAEIDDVRIMETRITLQGDSAEVYLRAHCRVRAPDWPYEYYISAWDLQMIRRGHDWRMISVHHRSEANLKAGDLVDLLRHQ